MSRLATTEVVTIWAPRPGHEKWREDYIALLNLQALTAKNFGHPHTIVTDTKDDEDLPEYSKKLRVELPQNLMRAMIAGVIARLSYPSMRTNFLFVDADVLIGRSLDVVFYAHAFDIGLTRREDPVAPINNGAMYVHHAGLAHAMLFFEKALSVCGEHWGADQEAISQVAAPVPERDGVTKRRGEFGRIAFLSMRDYACVPKVKGAFHQSKPYALHFKGETKNWAHEYARCWILGAV